MKKLGTKIYAPEIGRQFPNSVNVCRSAFSAHTCAVRRLNDYIDDVPYRCHHGSQAEKVPVIFFFSFVDGLSQLSTTMQEVPIMLPALCQL